MTYNIFDRLGFPSSLDDEVVEYSNTTINRLNSMPQLLNAWQMQDMANNNSSAYFINPANTHIVNLKDNILSIETLCTGVSELSTIYTAANNVITSNNLIDFSLHTDRMSNVLDPSVDEELPHYKTAISLGKILTYLLYQSDGVTNNSVLIGSFGSILKYNTVSQYSQTIANDKILIQNSIEVSGETTSSNLSPTQITNITSNINAMNTFVYTTMTEDKSFYANSRTLVSEYSTLRELNSMGQTQNNLILNYIGSEKLLERLNS
jgi:hypothetical protein